MEAEQERLECGPVSTAEEGTNNTVPLSSTARAATKEEEEDDDDDDDEEENSIIYELNNFDVLLFPAKSLSSFNNYNEDDDDDDDDIDNTSVASTLSLLGLPTDGMYACHVGNQRFKVTLDMYLAEFEQSYESGQDTTCVVQKLRFIVTEQCVPPGRFLQPNKDENNTTPDSNNGWKMVPSSRVDEFIQQALLLLLLSQKGREQQQLQHAASSPSTNQRFSFIDSANESAALAPVDATVTREDEKKRRRRSSLLRRSMSDNLQSSLVQTLEEKKKLNRTTEERRPSFFRLFRKFETVNNPDPLDVCFDFIDDGIEENETVLLTAQTMGNNRFRVLLQMSNDRYRTATVDEQTTMIQDWIHTVTQHWNARFLRKLDDDVWEVMETGAVEHALDSFMLQQQQQQQQQHPNQDHQTEANDSEFTTRMTMRMRMVQQQEEEDPSSLTFSPDDSEPFNDNNNNSGGGGGGGAVPTVTSSGGFGGDMQSSPFTFGGASTDVRVGTAPAVDVAAPYSVTSHPWASAGAGSRERTGGGGGGGGGSRRKSVKDYFSLQRGASDSNFTRTTSSGGGRISGFSIFHRGSVGQPPPQQQQQQQPHQHRLRADSVLSKDSTNTSNTALPEPSLSLLDNDSDLRSAAVQSLQRRKRRQGLASRLHKMAQQTSSLRSSFSGTGQPQHHKSLSPLSSLADFGSPSGFVPNNNNNSARSAATTASAATLLSSQQQQQQQHQPPLANIMFGGSHGGQRRSHMSTLSTDESAAYFGATAASGQEVQQRQRKQQQHHHHHQQPQPPPSSMPSIISTTFRRLSGGSHLSTSSFSSSGSSCMQQSAAAVEAMDMSGRSDTTDVTGERNASYAAGAAGSGPQGSFRLSQAFSSLLPVQETEQEHTAGGFKMSPKDSACPAPHGWNVPLLASNQQNNRDNSSSSMDALLLDNLVPSPHNSLVLGENHHHHHQAPTFMDAQPRKIASCDSLDLGDDTDGLSYPVVDWHVSNGVRTGSNHTTQLTNGS